MTGGTFTYGNELVEIQLRLAVLGRRVIVPYTGYHQHVALIEPGARIGAAKLWYDAPKKRFHVLICLLVEVADPTPQTHARQESEQKAAQSQPARLL